MPVTLASLFGAPSPFFNAQSGAWNLIAKRSPSKLCSKSEQKPSDIFASPSQKRKLCSTSEQGAFASPTQKRKLCSKSEQAKQRYADGPSSCSKQVGHDHLVKTNRKVKNTKASRSKGRATIPLKVNFGMLSVVGTASETECEHQKRHASLEHGQCVRCEFYSKRIAWFQATANLDVGFDRTIPRDVAR